jgi:mono/diheme cytochrome c family protein
LPDLATTSVAYHKLWLQLVQEGILARSKGMPAFKEVLTDEEATAIQHYVIREAQELYDEQQ